MLSILIPIYNFKVMDVVLELKAQAKKLDIPFEILCFDDASSTNKNTNSILKTEANIQYLEFFLFSPMPFLLQLQKILHVEMHIFWIQLSLHLV